MRKEIKKSETCSKCKTVLEMGEYEYYCDNCNVKLKEDTRDSCGHLNVEVYHQDSDKPSDDYQYCTWGCVLTHLPSIKCDYFINLPFLMFDMNEKGLRACDFFKLLKGD